MGWMLGADFTFWQYLVKNLIPVTLGNVVGGQMIGLVYYYIYAPPSPSRAATAMGATQAGKRAAPTLGGELLAV